MILDLKVRLSKFDLKELRIVAEKLEEVELDEEMELEHFIENFSRMFGKDVMESYELAGDIISG